MAVDPKVIARAKALSRMTVKNGCSAGEAASAKAALEKLLRDHNLRMVEGGEREKGIPINTASAQIYEELVRRQYERRKRHEEILRQYREHAEYMRRIEEEMRRLEEERNREVARTVCVIAMVVVAVAFGVIFF